MGNMLTSQPRSIKHIFMPYFVIIKKKVFWNTYYLFFFNHLYCLNSSNWSYFDFFRPSKQLIPSYSPSSATSSKQVTEKCPSCWPSPQKEEEEEKEAEDACQQKLPL